MTIIDTHQHLWDLDRLRLRWVENNPRLGKNHVLADYVREALGLPIARTIYMEVGADPAQHADEAAFILDLCARPDTPLAGAVVGGRPGAPSFAAYLDQFTGNPYLKGVRQGLHGGDTPPGFCLQDDFVRGVQMLGERGLCFDLCLRPTELGDGARLAARCSETRFVLDHCGNAPLPLQAQWARDIAAIADQPNVVVKISGIVASAAPDAWTPGDLAPIIDHTLDAFGPDRVLFGSDWPVCTKTATLAQWVGALQSVVASRSEQERRKLFHDNAVRFYHLDEPAETA